MPGAHSFLFPGVPAVLESCQAPGHTMWGSSSPLGRQELSAFSQGGLGSTRGRAGGLPGGPLGLLSERRCLAWPLPPSGFRLLLTRGGSAAPTVSGSSTQGLTTLDRGLGKPVCGQDLGCGLSTLNHLHICPRGAFPKCADSRAAWMVEPANSQDPYPDTLEK